MLSVSEVALRENLYDYCNRAISKNEPIIITRELEQHVVLLSLKEYEYMMNIVQQSMSPLVENNMLTNSTQDVLDDVLNDVNMSDTFSSVEDLMRDLNA